MPHRIMPPKARDCAEAPRHSLACRNPSKQEKHLISPPPSAIKRTNRSSTALTVSVSRCRVI